MSSAIFTPRDDGFHFDEMGEDWWATETAWFSFHHPQRRLGGWFYTLIRPTIGTVSGGAWVWDAHAHLPWEVPYCANYTALQLPRDQNLDNCQLPNGVSIRVLEPTLRYALRYADGERLQANLEFQGVMPPEPLTAVGSTFGNAHHFDQFGRVTGEIVLHGGARASEGASSLLEAPPGGKVPPPRMQATGARTTLRYNRRIP